MQNISINGSQFIRRSQTLYKLLNRPLLVMLGKTADVKDFNTNSALFYYLLGYEFSETILVIQEHPVAIASPKKSLLLQQIEGLKIVVRNKDDSNIDEIVRSSLGGAEYGIVDRHNIFGDLPNRILSAVKTADITQSVMDAIMVKEPAETDTTSRCALVANHLLRRGIDLIRDMNFSTENLENCMNDHIKGVDNALIEFSFDPEHSPNHLRLGVRYRGYCTEISRPFLTDLTVEYEIQKHMLSVVRPGVSSAAALEQLRGFAVSHGYGGSIDIYTVGLVIRERSFSEDFVLQENILFVLNLSNEFCNTFLLGQLPIFVTKKDSAEDYSETRMRFRNKSNDIAIVTKIKEHQRDLLDSLIEERLGYHKSHNVQEIVGKTEGRAVFRYEKDSMVPRSPNVYLDWENMYVLVPLLSYSVPFHISTIKNVAATGTGTTEPKLRINFKESKELLEGTDREYDTFIKSITVHIANSEDLLPQINEMKKEFNKPKVQVNDQGALREKFKKYALTDLYVRTDIKSNTKKSMSNLEMHENGFRYGDIVILFSNVKNIFFCRGDFENKAILHFNLREPIAVGGKSTYNVQFFRKYGFTYHDTAKREDERMEYIQQQQEEAEIDRINSEFLFFIEIIEQDSSLRVQLPERGFLGVHSKEAVHVFVTNDCLISVSDQPFFILNFNEVEIVNFERVTFVTKTFDCVFVFKNKAKPVVPITSIDTTRLGFIKEMLDSRNIVFMETKVNINWPNLMATIMRDPLGFYESGGWAELLREEDEDDSGVVTESLSETEDDTVGSTTSSEGSEAETSYDTTEDESEDIVASNDTSDDDDYEPSSEDSRDRKRSKTGSKRR